MKKMSLRRSLSLKVGGSGKREKQQLRQSAYTHSAAGAAAAAAEASSSNAGRQEPRPARKREGGGNKPAKKVGITIDAGAAGSENRCVRERTEKKEMNHHGLIIRRGVKTFSVKTFREFMGGGRTVTIVVHAIPYHTACSFVPSHPGWGEREAGVDGMVFPRPNPQLQLQLQQHWLSPFRGSHYCCSEQQESGNPRTAVSPMSLRTR